MRAFFIGMNVIFVIGVAGAASAQTAASGERIGGSVALKAAPLKQSEEPKGKLPRRDPGATAAAAQGGEIPSIGDKPQVSTTGGASSNHGCAKFEVWDTKRRRCIAIEDPRK